MMLKKNKKRLDWILPYGRQYAWRLLAAACVATIAVACAGALLFTSGYLISRSSLRPENVLMVYVPIVLVRAFGFGKAVIQYLERLISHDTVLRILAQMRLRLYRVLEPQALYIRSRYRSGDLLGLLAEDIERLQHVFLRVVLPAIVAVLIYGTGIALLGRMDISFALLMAAYIFFLLFTVPTFVLWRSIHQRKRHMAKRSSVYRGLTDALFGLSDWVLSGRSAQFVADFNRKQASLTDMEARLRRSEWNTQWLSQCAIGGAVLLMAFWAGTMHGDGKMDAEWIAAYVLITFPLLEALARSGEALMRIPDYQTSIQRLQNVEKRGWSILPANRQHTPMQSTSSNGKIAVDTLKQKGVDLHLQRVFFRHTNTEEWGLCDINLHLPQGTKLALIGRSGAGKTTLLNVIQGELTPVSGSVTVNGRTISEVIREQGNPGELFAVLNQKPYLFDTTLANNIRMGRPQATDHEVRLAAEAAGLGSLIASLPHGIETRVRESGYRFSGGERQRIALARILLQDRPVVLLDEPMVGLDPLIERSLLHTIFSVLHGKTLVWVTHHLSGMEQMDQIVFLDRGRIVMHGRHEQLLQEHERYRRLYALDHPSAWS